jgi:hypothetical protein
MSNKFPYCFSLIRLPAAEREIHENPLKSFKGWHLTCHNIAFPRIIHVAIARTCLVRGSETSNKDESSRRNGRLALRVINKEKNVSLR